MTSVMSLPFVLLCICRTAWLTISRALRVFTRCGYLMYDACSSSWVLIASYRLLVCPSVWHLCVPGQVGMVSVACVRCFDFDAFSRVSLHDTFLFCAGSDIPTSWGASMLNSIEHEANSRPQKCTWLASTLKCSTSSLKPTWRFNWDSIRYVWQSSDRGHYTQPTIP